MNISLFAAKCRRVLKRNSNLLFFLFLHGSHLKSDRHKKLTMRGTFFYILHEGKAETFCNKDKLVEFMLSRRRNIFSEVFIQSVLKLKICRFKFELLPHQLQLHNHLHFFSILAGMTIALFCVHFSSRLKPKLQNYCLFTVTVISGRQRRKTTSDSQLVDVCFFSFFKDHLNYILSCLFTSRP